MADIVRFSDSGWEVRELNGDGVRRVSGTEIGKRLGYYPAKPTTFNEKFITKGLKEGKFKDYDIVEGFRQCKKGFGVVRVPEYWMPFQSALRMAMEVQTGTAKEIRQKVIDSLQKMIAALALPAPAEPANEAIVAAVDRAMTRHTEALSKAITEGIVLAVSAAVAPLVRSANSLYIDEDRRAELIYVCRMIVRTSVQKTCITDIWDGVRESNRFRPGKVFSTVWSEKFDAVLRSLLEQLKLAEEMRRLKDKEDALALEEKEREKALKVAAAPEPSNVLRPTNWHKSPEE